MTRPHPDLLVDHLNVDRVLHEPARLVLLAFLNAVGRADYTALRTYSSLSDGNLGSHLRKMEDAGYVKVTKRFENRRPKSSYRLTRKGRSALAAYLSGLHQLISFIGPVSDAGQSEKPV